MHRYVQISYLDWPIALCCILHVSQTEQLILLVYLSDCQCWIAQLTNNIYKHNLLLLRRNNQCLFCTKRTHSQHKTHDERCNLYLTIVLKSKYEVRECQAERSQRNILTIRKRTILTIRKRTSQHGKNPRTLQQ